MIKRTPALFFFIFVLLLAAVHMIHYYPLLSDKVASHYDFSGKVDSWMSKDIFMIVYVGAILLTAVLILGFCYFLPRIPPSMMNMPNREYWLSPERRDSTFGDLSNRILWLGNAILAFLISMIHIIFQMNIENRQRLGISFWVILIAFFIIIALWSVQLIRKFQKIPDTQNV